VVYQNRLLNPNNIIKRMSHQQNVLHSIPSIAKGCICEWTQLNNNMQLGFFLDISFISLDGLAITIKRLSSIADPK